ncbi:tyrosine-type recombinase/integrase [Cytobacillus kochii]|uniref:tyrosine-type recombinase/integrase n=1 Tax=Cytobacillus kochii TaxID=859143 RepID=UPI00402AE54E
MFTCSEGYPYTIQQYSNRLQRLLKRIPDLNKHITPHSFRLLIEANVNMKVISHRLGHSSVLTSDEIYGHLTRGLEKKASQQFSELMKGLHI